MSSRDRELVRDLRRRDSDAFRRFHLAYLERIYRFCLRLSGCATDAEDPTQEVFLAAYQSADRFEGRCSPGTWLYRIAVFRWRKMREKAGFREAAAGLYPETHGGSPWPGAEVIRLALEEAIITLPDSLREAFLLVKVEGLTYRETAAALELPVGTVQARVHCAVVRLRQILRDDATVEHPSQPGEETDTCTVIV